MTNRRPAPHVEVFGLAGAGKTTLRQRLAAVGSDLGAERSEPSRGSLVRGGLSVLLHAVPQAPMQSVQMLASPGGRWLLAKLSYRLAVHTARPTHHPFIAWDAGYLEPFITLETYHPRPGRVPMDALLAAVPAPVLALHAQCDAEVARRRFMHREGLGEDDFVAFEPRFRSSMAAIGSVREWLAQMAIPTVEIDLTETPSDGQVLDVLTQITEHASRAGVRI